MKQRTLQTSQMIDAERFKLLHGPYRPPRCRLGKKLVCVIKGRVPVTRLSDAKIVWPVTTKRGGKPSIIVCGSLVTAIRRESEIAIAHHWGVSLATAYEWRKALGVPATNEGTRRLKRDHFKEPWALKAMAEFHRRCRDETLDAARRAKIAATKRGKPRPRHVIEAMRRGRLGKPHSEEARRKMSEAQRRRGTRPPAAGPAWEPADEALLGRMPDKVVAKRTGRTLIAVQGRRYKLRIEKFGRTGRGLAKEHHKERE